MMCTDVLPMRQTTRSQIMHEIRWTFNILPTNVFTRSRVSA